MQKIIKGILILLLLTLGTQAVLAGVVYSLHFKGESIEGGNMLSWKTISEADNHYFVIERSKDGLRFEQAAKVEGAGNSEELKQYRFLDITAGTDRTFYRLVQTDYDGTQSTSHTLILSKEDQGYFEITAVNSNVTDRYFTLTVNAQLTTEMEYRVMTMMGDIKKKGTSQLVEGINAIAVDLEKLEDGSYQFALKVKNEIEVLVIRKTDRKAPQEENLATKNKTIRN